MQNGLGRFDPARIESKIIRSDEQLNEILQCISKENGKIVFSNGCFDIIHYGHVQYLAKARTFGDIMIVGINTDASIKRIKGEKRPVITENERLYMLASLECIDYVILFDEDTPVNLIQKIQPDIMVKGSDWKIEQLPGREIVEAKGGQVILVDLVAGLSTTGIIQKIKDVFGPI
jgi:D-beta-D-heptose 7-phosphate kinase/D-beta-D-heptose 1-phosphate adenosyltransferase